MKLAFLAATLALGACQNIFNPRLQAPVRHARKLEIARWRK